MHEHAHHFDHNDNFDEYKNKLNALAEEISTQVLDIQAKVNEGTIKVLDFRFVYFKLTIYGASYCLPYQKVDVLFEDSWAGVHFGDTVLRTVNGPRGVRIDMLPSAVYGKNGGDVLGGNVYKIGKHTFVRRSVDSQNLLSIESPNIKGKAWLVFVLEDCSKMPD